MVTAPAARPTRLILLLKWSVTKSAAPSAVIVTPNGYLNRAAPPTPSASPLSPLPASVVTAPVATATRLILWFQRSATKSALPSGLIVMPDG